MTAPFVANSYAGYPVKSVVTEPFLFSGSNTAREDMGIYFTTANYTDYVESATQAGRTSGGSGATRVVPTGYASGNTLMSWYSSGGTEVLRIRSTGTNTFQLQYWNGASFTAVGSAAALSGSGLRYRHLVDFTGLNGSSGVLRYQIVEDSTEVVLSDQSASSLTLTSITDIAKFRLFCPNSSSSAYQISETFLKDGSAITAYCYGRIPTANGTDATDGTGSYTALDDNNTATPDADFLSLPSSGNKRSFKVAARNFGGRYCKAVTREVRMRCGATGVTQVKPYLLIGGTRYYHSSSPVTLTTTFTNYQYTWELDPSTSAAWGANAESANLEWGIEVV